MRKCLVTQPFDIVPTFRLQRAAKLAAQCLSENRRTRLQLYDYTTLIVLETLSPSAAGLENFIWFLLLCYLLLCPPPQPGTAFHSSVAKRTCKCLSTWTFQALQNLEQKSKGSQTPGCFVERPPSAVDHQMHVHFSCHMTPCTRNFVTIWSDCRFLGRFQLHSCRSSCSLFCSPSSSQWTRYETPEDTLSDIFPLSSELSKKVSCFLFLLLSCLPLFALQGQLMAGQCWYCRFINLPVESPVEQSYQNIMDHHGIGTPAIFTRSV